MEEEEADRSTSAQHFHTGFAKRALREQSRAPAACIGDRPEWGKGVRRGKSWRMLTGSTGREEDRGGG